MSTLGEGNTSLIVFSAKKLAKQIKCYMGCRHWKNLTQSWLPRLVASAFGWPLFHAVKSADLVGPTIKLMIHKLILETMLSNMPAFVFCSAFGNFVDLSKSFDNYQVMSSLPYSPRVLVKVAPSEKRNTPSSSLRVTMHHLSLFPCLALTSTHMSSIPTQKSSTWSELRVEWRRSSTSAVLGAARRPPARGGWEED